MFLSVVTPVYKADGIINTLVNLVTAECSLITDGFEIILVNDGSPDNSWAVIMEVALINKNVVGINLSRNFGQHAAINAGLALAKGDCIIVMDCDMQHHPKYIPQLVNKIKEGYDIVFTTTAKRSHSFFKNMLSAIYHRIYNYLTELDSNYNFTTYSIASKKVITVYKTLDEYNGHYLPKLRWLGFKQTSIPIEHLVRENGKSSYNIKALLIEGINGLTSNSVKLLRLNVFAGLLLSAVSFIAIAVIIAMYFISGFLAGWASVTVLIMFSLGIILTSIGITGLYIGQTFEQVKKRPHYIVSDTVNG